jgi:hypothetical protein
VRGTRKIRRRASPPPPFTPTSLRTASIIKGALLNLSKANSPERGADPTTARGASLASVIPDIGSAPVMPFSKAVNKAVCRMKSVVTAVPISVAVAAYPAAPFKYVTTSAGQLVRSAGVSGGDQPPQKSDLPPMQ